MNETLDTVNGRPMLRMERRLAQPPETVWRSITEPERLSRWYPFPATELDLRVGGAMRFDDGQGTTMDALITELDPPLRFAFSEHPPVGMVREGEDLVRFELRQEDDGCLLIFTHAFDDRPAAASYASGWQLCLDAFERVVADQPVDMSAYPSAELHDAYVETFGLNTGSVEDTPEGWLVRFERQLTQPVDTVWSLLCASSAAEPETGSRVPPAFTAGPIPPGAVAEITAPTVLEYDWRHRDRPVGRVRWELSPGTGHGARLVLTQTGPKELTEERTIALSVWRTRIDLLAEELRSVAT